MSFANPPRPARRESAERRKVSPLGVTAAVIAAIVALVLLAANFWTEVLWFNQLGFGKVIWTQWGAKAALFAVGFLIMAVVVGLNLNLAFRNRPVYAPSTPEQATLDQYREAIEPLRRLVMVALPAVLGVFAGLAAAARWEDILLWLNGGSFGVEDPQWGIDISFFVFTLPALRFVVSLLMAVLIVSLVATLAMHYLYGGLRAGAVAPGESRATGAARIQLSVLAAVFMLLLAANYWLDRFALLTTQGERFAGADYADINSVVPAKSILAGVAVLVAVLFVLTAVRGNWRIPAIGVGLMVVSAIAIGGIYPAVVERFQVQPNAQELEAEYIQRNIDATRTAFGIDEVDPQEYDAKTTATAGALREDSETTASIRLLDPSIVSPSFKQLQQNKQYYDFADTLSVDRYDIDGEKRDTVIAVRELNLAGVGADQRNWVNDHLVYTHGYGVAAAFGNSTTTDGQPSFFEGGIPSVGELDEYEPRIYFGQMSPDYSIVGAPEGTEPWELDYPDTASGQVLTTFPTQKVAVGPSVGTFMNKVLYAIKFGEDQILFSDRVNDASQIIYDRDPRTRVQKVAPYLTLDGRVYPAVVDGRVKWIVDGYTTTNNYPYSASASLDDATTDSLTARAAVAQLAPERVNYIRNSVKATVDAYDGTVTLYAWDAEDPILKAWSKVFPAAITPLEEISGDLMSHIRYPEGLFKVQRSLLAAYHVTSPAVFFSGQDLWKSPVEPTATGTTNAALQPPYYLSLQMPDQTAPAFSLMSTFIPGGNSDRQILTGYLAVDSEAGDQAGKPAEGYGKLRLLTLPKDSTVPAPGQVQNTFNSDPTISNQLNILKGGNSTVINGNLLTVPVGGGLLYVQPVYVQSSGGTKLPLLRKVLVSFGDKVGYADTLGEALDQVFSGDSGVDLDGEKTDTDVPTTPLPPDDGETPPATETPTPTETATPTEPTTPTTPPAAGTPREQLDAALQAASQAMKDSEAALTAGDFAKYGEAQKRLNDALQKALEAEGTLD